MTHLDLLRKEALETGAGSIQEMAKRRVAIKREFRRRGYRVGNETPYEFLLEFKRVMDESEGRTR